MLNFFSFVDTFGFKGLTPFDKVRFPSFASVSRDECMTSSGTSSMSLG